MKGNCDIDFVITWVDGNDAHWKAQFDSHKSTGHSEDVGAHRFRDWDILHYWFRCVEKNAPWVRKIHFVTSGHYPEWLNIDHPKINVVKHEDYMPEEYLPVFNSRPIELLLNNLNDLSEQFVLFNDDMFLIGKSQPNDFFQKGLPLDMAVISAQSGAGISNVIMNDLKVINLNFDKYKVLEKHPLKFFNFKYGFKVFRTLLLMPWSRFTGFYDPHQPQSYLVSTFNKIWNKAPKELTLTCQHKFRNGDNVNHYLARYWQLVSGCFKPSKSRGAMFNIIEDSVDSVKSALNSRSLLTMCLNDAQCDEDFFLKRKLELKVVFEELYSSKSTFEL